MPTTDTNNGANAVAAVAVASEVDGWMAEFEAENQEVLSVSGDIEEAAHNLYSAMHRLDALNLKKILAERVPNIGIGVAINDKLERASFKKYK